MPSNTGRSAQYRAVLFLDYAITIQVGLYGNPLQEIHLEPRTSSFYLPSVQSQTKGACKGLDDIALVVALHFLALGGFPGMVVVPLHELRQSVPDAASEYGKPRPGRTGGLLVERLGCRRRRARRCQRRS